MPPCAADRVRVGRRTVLRAAGRRRAARRDSAVAGCGRSGPDPRLAIGSGTRPGVYIRMAEVLADAWDERLDLTVRPEVLSTAGSVANMALLRAGRAPARDQPGRRRRRLPRGASRRTPPRRRGRWPASTTT